LSRLGTNRVGENHPSGAPSLTGAAARPQEMDNSVKKMIFVLKFIAK